MVQSKHTKQILLYMTLRNTMTPLLCMAGQFCISGIMINAELDPNTTSSGLQK